MVKCVLSIQYRSLTRRKMQIKKKLTIAFFVGSLIPYTMFDEQEREVSDQFLIGLGYFPSIKLSFPCLFLRYVCIVRTCSELCFVKMHTLVHRFIRVLSLQITNIIHDSNLRTASKTVNTELMLSRVHNNNKDFI